MQACVWYLTYDPGDSSVSPNYLGHLHIFFSQTHYIRNQTSIRYEKDLKKTFKTDWDLKQEIGMHFCGQAFSVVTDKYMLKGSA